MSIVFVFAMTAAVAFAQQPEQAQGLANEVTPQSFVQQVVDSNTKEIDIAKLAATRAASADVKSFGAQLVSDHSKVVETLRGYAQRKNITLPPMAKSETLAHPSAADKEHAVHFRDLSAKSGAEFDQAFIQMMVEKHEKGVTLFERQSQAKLGDQELQQFVNDTLPTLRSHLARAKEIQPKTAADAPTIIQSR
jgi:putative membrane protein